MALQYIENKETLNRFYIPIPHGRVFADIDENGVPSQVWCVVEGNDSWDGEAYLVYDCTQNSANAQMIAPNFCEAITNASRVLSKYDSVRVFANAPYVTIDAHGEHCHFTQRIGAKVDRNGRVEFRLNMLKAWLKSNKNGVMGLQGLTLKNGENSHVSHQYQYEHQPYQHVTNPAQTTLISMGILAKLQAIAQKYGNSFYGWMHNMFIRVTPLWEDGNGLWYGNMHYVMTDGYSMYSGNEKVSLQSNIQFDFNIHKDAINALFMATKKYRGDIYIHADGKRTTIETSAIQCTCDIVKPPLKESVFSIGHQYAQYFDDAQWVTSTDAPATKYKKGDLCHFDGTRIVMGELKGSHNVQRVYIPDDIVWEHQIALHDHMIAVRYEGNIAIINQISPR